MHESNRKGSESTIIQAMSFAATNKIVEPISHPKRERVVSHTAELITQSSRIFNQSIPSIPVRFDLPGKAAGMYVRKGSEKWIRFNPWLFSKFFDENLKDTVPHEVAHYVVDHVYGRKGIKPHGIEWKNLMRELGVNPVRTCDFDLTGIPTRNHRRFDYRCDCQTHAISTRMHNAIARNVKMYLCKKCRQPLRQAIE